MFRRSVFATVFTIIMLFLPSQNIGVLAAVGKTTMNEKAQRAANFIQDIQNRINESEDELKLLTGNIGALRKRLNETEIETTSLKLQLENLENLIKENEEKRARFKLLIAEYKNSILTLADEIKLTEKTIRDIMRPFVSALKGSLMQSSIFFSENGAPNLLSFLGSSENEDLLLREEEYRIFLQNAAVDLGENLLVHQKKLINQKETLAKKKTQLSSLEILLNQEMFSLIAAEEAKQRLLADTQGKQELYETLLERSRAEESSVNQEIQRLKENSSFFEEKLNTLKTLPLNETDSGKTDFLSVEPLRGLNTTFAWPVSPSLGITAYFKDEAYKRALGIEHNAIDIRLQQGSPVGSAQDGVISKVADNGFGYSYIIVTHPDGFMTLYGHVSQILVVEGQLVRQGEVIGLSGGIPGTKGAGWLTTGAHLHFEIFKDFKHTDPLLYLPLEYLPLKSLPEKYLKLIIP